MQWKFSRPPGGVQTTTGLNVAIRYGQQLIQATSRRCMIGIKQALDPTKKTAAPLKSATGELIPDRAKHWDGTLGAAILRVILQRDCGNRRSTERHQVPSCVAGAWQWSSPWRIKQGSWFPWLWQSTWKWKYPCRSPEVLQRKHY